MVNQTTKSKITVTKDMIIMINDWTSNVVATNHIRGTVIKTENLNKTSHVKEVTMVGLAQNQTNNDHNLENVVEVTTAQTSNVRGDTHKRILTEVTIKTGNTQTEMEITTKKITKNKIKIQKTILEELNIQNENGVTTVTNLVTHHQFVTKKSEMIKQRKNVTKNREGKIHQ